MAIEPNQGMRRHKLLPADVRRTLPGLHETDGQGMDAIVRVKLFCPYGRATLYVTEFDGDDTTYGYMVSPLGPDCDEWGYNSFRELAEAARGRLPMMERDCGFADMTVAEALAQDGAAVAA